MKKKFLNLLEPIPKW